MGEPVTEEMLATMREERAAHQASVHNGLAVARATLAEIARRWIVADDHAQKDIAIGALSAVIEAERTLRAADALVSGDAGGMVALRRVCAARVLPPERNAATRKEGKRHG